MVKVNLFFFGKIGGRTVAGLKIDVEGFEPDVLRGLSIPVESLSFEFLPASLDSAFESIEIVSRLGWYEFNYSMVETMKLASRTWLSGDELTSILKSMEPRDRSGDIYARRTTA